MTYSSQSKQRPIKGYIQLLKMLFYIVGLVLVVTTILDKSPVGILSGIGALSAVLLLIFRDTILGLVAISFATMHVVGGFMVTERMLEMFKKK